MWADHHEPEELAVAGFVDRLNPAHGLVLHHGAGVGYPGEGAGGDVVPVLLAGRRLGQPDAGDLGIRVDRPRHGAVVHDRVIAERVLGRDLAFAEGRVRELTVAGDVTDRVDVPDGRPAARVGGNPLRPLQP